MPSGSRLHFSLEDASFKEESAQYVDAGPPTSLSAPISPPSSSRREPGKLNKASHEQYRCSSTDDALLHGAKRSKRKDHSTTITPVESAHLYPPPLLPLPSAMSLYRRNQNAQGHHFVIHQHDHPIAGLHYDLRLQFSATSSLSWAVPYGVPGNANSRRGMRMAAETRVHTLRSHLIESGSRSGGSMLIWDTGTYEILPRRKDTPSRDPDSDSGSESGEGLIRVGVERQENEKLVEAFGKRKIRIRFHGARLPRGYTLNMCVAPDSKHTPEPRPGSKKRKRINPAVVKSPEETASEGDESDAAMSISDVVWDSEAADKQERRAKDDEQNRRVNAYSGAENSVGSVYQRKWYLSLDRHGSGFYKASREVAVWERKEGEGGARDGFEPFFVKGIEKERSVVTGRRAEDVLRDAGVVGFVRRKGWRPIVE